MRRGGQPGSESQEPRSDKPLVWLAGIESPPVGADARRELGWLLRRLQRGEKLSMPESRPMPSIGPGVHELRVTDGRGEWRLLLRIDVDAIVIVDTFSKKSARTPHAVIDRCRRRLLKYDADTGAG